MTVTSMALAWMLSRQSRQETLRYRALLGNNHAVMLVVEPDSGVVLDASAAAAEIQAEMERAQHQNVIPV